MALCGTMWRYVALSERNNFVTFCDFCISWKIAVALCGAMWHYPKRAKMIFGNFLQFMCFLENSCGTMWHYVALCGAIRKEQQCIFCNLFAISVFHKKLQNNALLFLSDSAT